MVLPNFLIIGEHKAGTSSLYNYLKQHDDVFMPELKEARYFAFDKNNPAHINLVPRIFPISTLDEYVEIFDPVVNERAIGEASPNYFNTPGAEKRIHECIPDVKLIVSIRNPVDRIYSLYQMNVRDGVEERSFIEAFRQGKDEWWISSSFPYVNLKRYTEQFKKENIKIILFDDLKSSPDKVMSELYSYLGVDEDFLPDMSTSHNAGGLPKNKLLHLVLQKIKENDLIKNLIKKYLPTSLIHSAKAANQKNMKKAVPLEPHEREEVLDFYREDIVKLGMLIDRDLSSWK